MSDSPITILASEYKAMSDRIVTLAAENERLRLLIATHNIGCEAVWGSVSRLAWLAATAHIPLDIAPIAREIYRD